MKVESKLVVTLHYDEFDNMVREHFPVAKDYEVVAYQEMNNDSNIVVDIDMAFHNKYSWEPFDEPRDFMFRANDIVHELYKAGKFPVGDDVQIIINISW